MFFGFMLGVLTIYAGGKVATGFLVFGVPLLDLVIVVFRRILKGTSPMKGNAVDEHLHHRLLRKGWSQRSVIFLMLAIGSIFGVTALFLSTTQKFLAGGVLFLCMLLLSVYTEPRKNQEKTE
jgi:UDP-GlcNAc:undecaprenyl-phosphate GlcNAc-1-phosphate transferase